MSRRRSKTSDQVLLGTVVILVLIGILMIYSASSFRAAEMYNHSAFFLKHHLVRVLMGFLFLLVFSQIDYQRFRSMTPLLLFVFIFLLVVVLLLPEFHGSRRSLLILNRRFQPSEFMKLTIILYLAAVFARGKKAPSHNNKTLSVHYMIFLLAVGLVLIEPDLGTSLVIFFIGFAMFYLGGVSMRQLSQMVLVLIPLISLGFGIFPYQRQRLMDYVVSLTDTTQMSYQVKQSVIGLAHGGLFGVGYGGGKQKLFFLPEPFSDFILANLGEEFGFVGIAVVFILLGIILWWGIRIAKSAPDRYGFLLAGGITSMILINGLINAGVVVNLLPTTGLPFPFLSYGGSSLFVHLIAVGILVNISKKASLNYRDFTLRRGMMERWEDS
jgi:cell division protein FtsW